MYELAIDEEAMDFLEKQAKPVRERIFKKILSSKEDPHHFFERLEGRRDYKLRVGDYRVIADIDDNKEQIQITIIGHRKNIYKNI